MTIDLFGGETASTVAAYFRVSDTSAGPTPALMFSGLMIGLPDLAALTSDDAIRNVVAGVFIRARRDNTLTARQHTFWTDHVERLTETMFRPRERPYAPGTRIAVHHGDPRQTTTGRILAVADEPTGPAYLWRPDLADLPGHPWFTHPTWALRTPAHHVTPTLAGPDTNINPDEPLMTTGALVATIDDPRFTVGTVLRAFHDDEHHLTYEIQPHDGALPPQRIPLDDVTPLRGTAWPTVEALLEARALANLSPQPGEILATTREMSFVIDTPLGAGVTFPSSARYLRPSLTVTDTTPILISENATPPAETPPAASSTTQTPRLRYTGDTIHIDDPVHGHLEVAAAAFHTAMRQHHDTLATALACRPWLATIPDQPKHVTAALTAIHAPHDLAALDTAFTRHTPGRPTSSSPPNPPGPDITTPPQTPTEDPTAPPPDGPTFDTGP
ncbi:hypothetical protein [Pseudofrankia sp. DC12]|uniref:hypothetical protein n=1 Tax=Pseudofrankia sp. DC12 TaxID=683315 RepID=UPI0006971216|nr:hypothetical protein [Pseudofrankia sp. DC12]